MGFAYDMVPGVVVFFLLRQIHTLNKISKKMLNQIESELGKKQKYQKKRF